MTQPKKKPRETKRPARLRERAETLMERSPAAILEMSGGDVRNLVHELRVHQAELEMKNEELRRVQLDLENSRDRFAHFYNLAPVGYLTLDTEGVIREANQTAARLLGLDRRALLKKELSRFIAAASQDDFYLHRQQVFTTANRQSCELQMRRAGKAVFIGRLESVTEADATDVSSQCLVALSDVTHQVELEREILRISELEQQRLGQELHGDVCQQLTGIEFLAHGLEQELARKSKTDSRQAAQIARLLREANSRVRDLSHGLAPLHLDTDGLIGALESLALRTRQLFGSDCKVRCDQPGAIDDPEVGLHLYRIAQEAVTNAIKHGRAKRIDIRLKANGDRLVLGIHDNGAGLPTTPRRGKGMGLRLMQYRARLISGSLAVQREAAGGTSVVFSLHLANALRQGGKKP